MFSEFKTNACAPKLTRRDACLLVWGHVVETTTIRAICRALMIRIGRLGRYMKASVCRDGKGHYRLLYVFFWGAGI